jgi:Protein of unknown function (DUF2281)
MLYCQGVLIRQVSRNPRGQQGIDLERRSEQWMTRGQKMSLDESFLEKLRDLPPDKQREAIDFVEYLHKKSAATGPKRSLKGIWSDLGVDITGEDIAQARSEMWGKFPREDI